MYLVDLDTSKDDIEMCCAGLGKLENSSWYKYTDIENNMPHVKVSNDSIVKYFSPQFVTELVNNEFLFIMRENWFNFGANPLLYKLQTDNKFYRDQWKNYLENATVFRSDSVRISDENMKIVIETFKNETYLERQMIPIFGMKTDGIGNIWIWGSQFVVKATTSPTTSITESTQKPTVIYPNPGNQTIRLGNVHKEVSKIEIQNLTGRTVKTIVGDFNEIPISELSNGMYFVKIYSQNGNIEVLKFIKE